MNIKVAAGIACAIVSAVYISNHSVPKTAQNKFSGIDRIKSEADCTGFGAQSIDVYKTTTKLNTQDTLIYSNKYFASVKDVSENLINIFRQALNKIK